MTILPVLFMALSCKDTHLAHGPDAGGTNNTLKAGIAAYAGGAGQLQGEDNISTLEAYHFDGGKLVRTYTSFTSSDGGSTFGIDLDSRSGTLYLVALGADGPDYARPRQLRWPAAARLPPSPPAGDAHSPGRPPRGRRGTMSRTCCPGLSRRCCPPRKK